MPQGFSQGWGHGGPNGGRKGGRGPVGLAVHGLSDRDDVTKHTEMGYGD